MFFRFCLLDNSKPEDPLDNLHLDLRNIRQRFESGKAGDEEKEKEKESPRILSPTEKSSLKRSESIHQKMLK